MFPTSMPTVMGVNAPGVPATEGGGGGGASFPRTFTGAAATSGALQVMKRGRIFGRPGTCSISIDLPGSLAIRVRRT